MKNLLLAIMLFFPFVANAQEEKTYPFEVLYQKNGYYVLKTLNPA